MKSGAIIFDSSFPLICNIQAVLTHYIHIYRFSNLSFTLHYFIILVHVHDQFLLGIVQRASKHLSLFPFYLPLSNTTCLCIHNFFYSSPHNSQQMGIYTLFNSLFFFNYLEHIFISTHGDPPLLSKDCTVFNYKHIITPKKNISIVSRLLSLQILASTCQVLTILFTE